MFLGNVIGINSLFLPPPCRLCQPFILQLFLMYSSILYVVLRGHTGFSFWGPPPTKEKVWPRENYLLHIIMFLMAS